MKSPRLLTIAILVFRSVTVLGDTNPEDIPLSFPCFQSGQSSGDRDELMVGYGDWCCVGEQLHMGIDFFAESHSDQVIVPYDSSLTLYSIGADYTPDPDYKGCILGIGPDDSEYGWAIEHLGPDEDKNNAPFDWCMNHARGTISFQGGAPIDTCSDYSLGDVPLHTHIQWSHWTPDGSPGGAQIADHWDALVNPFDYFMAGELDGYDNSEFKNVYAEQDASWFGVTQDSTNTGIFFLPDGIVSEYLYSTTLGDGATTFQDIVYSTVDIAVAPYSALLGYPENDSCGVFSLGYEIFYQYPLDPNLWYSTESVEGDWGFRELFRAEDEIGKPGTGDWDDIYYSLFFNCDIFQNNYIVTNSGADDHSSWQHGWDNVWTDASDDDWTDGICRGSWNTFLAKQEYSGDPTQNCEAFFPDGRYAVEVTAESHGARASNSMLLPVDDLDLPDPSTEGVVVDNHLPFIAGVFAYDVDAVDGSRTLIFSQYWEEASGRITARDAEISERLHELRQQLWELERSGENETTLAQVGNVSETTASNHLEVASDRAAIADSPVLGSDPAGYSSQGRPDREAARRSEEYFRSEIERLESELLESARSDREIVKQVNAYVPSGLSLELEVFYSEPIDRSISDVVYLRSYMGPDTSESYEFARVEPASDGRPVHDDEGVVDRIVEENPLLEDQYAVTYVIDDPLPTGYHGNILLFFGEDDLPEDMGPRDLAGNSMDADPSSKSDARNGYNPFSYTGFTAGQETNYTWDPPDWQLSGETIARGFVGSECIASIDIEELGLSNPQFIGDCDYYCGFWCGSWEYGAYGFDLNVVKPDESIVTYSFTSPNPYQGNDFSVMWEPEAGFLNDEHGRYCWATGHWVDVHFLVGNDWYGSSGTIAYRADAQGGGYQEEVINGPAFFGDPRDGGLEGTAAGIIEGQDAWISGAECDSIHQDGSATYDYCVYEKYNYGIARSGYKTLPSKVADSDSLSGNSAEDSMHAVEEDICILLMDNPCVDNLNLMLSVGSETSYSIELFDLTGRRVRYTSGMATGRESSVSFNVGALPSGTYFVRATTEEAQTTRTICIVH